MRSKEIINDLNKIIDKLSDDIEETKKMKTLEPFISHMQILNEIKAAKINLDKASLIMSNYIESKNDSSQK